MIYLASPYSNPDHTVREARYCATRDYVFQLAFAEKRFIFSPIVYAHRAALELDMPTNAAAWSLMNEQAQREATELWILPLEGWEESIGVQAEMKFAQSIGQPVTIMFGTRGAV